MKTLQRSVRGEMHGFQRHLGRQHATHDKANISVDVDSEDAPRAFDAQGSISLMPGIEIFLIVMAVFLAGLLTS
jgi:hypothetical protein